MKTKLTLAALAAAAAFCFMPQSASAAPPVGDAKQATTSNVEQAHYRKRHRHYRHRHYRGRHYHGPRRYYGSRNYYRRPGFGIYLGF
jgi:hypothetical protein